MWSFTTETNHFEIDLSAGTLIGVIEEDLIAERAYPADFRFPAKKEILVDLGMWEPIGSTSAEKHGL
jgi:hypothetical protein